MGDFDYVNHENIRCYRNLIAMTTDDPRGNKGRHQTLVQLLAEEEAKHTKAADWPMPPMQHLLALTPRRKGMVLTSRGNELREPLRLALQNLQDVIGTPSAFDPEKSDRVFTIGANDNATAIIGSRLVSLARRHGLSGIRFAFRSIDLMRLTDQLEAGDLDVALVSKDAVPNGMPAQPLLEERFMMAQRKDHPRGLRPPTIREYARLEHVIVSGEGGGFRSFIDDILATNELTRRVAVSVQHYSVVPLLLQSTDLVCTLPQRFLSRYHDVLQSLRVPFDTRPFTLHATWHARFDNDRGHQWLRQQLKDCAAG